MRRYYDFFAGGGMVQAGMGDGWRCLYANDIDPKKGFRPRLSLDILGSNGHRTGGVSAASSAAGDGSYTSGTTREIMMIRPYLSEEHQKEAFSYAYLMALASECGYSCQRGPHPDLDSIDATISTKGEMRAQIGVQLKATAVPQARGTDLKCRLGSKNYNDLRVRRLVPLLLVVLELPRERDRWLSWSSEELVLRRRAWWLSLAGAAAVESGSTTVSLPGTQLLSPDELQAIMLRVAKGELR